MQLHILQMLEYGLCVVEERVIWIDEVVATLCRWCCGTWGVLPMAAAMSLRSGTDEVGDGVAWWGRS